MPKPIFIPLAGEARQNLYNALRGNADNDLAIVMDSRDTSFIGTSSGITDEDDDVVFKIKSVPCHY